jgi:hypothetical protein
MVSHPGRLSSSLFVDTNFSLIFLLKSGSLIFFPLFPVHEVLPHVSVSDLRIEVAFPAAHGQFASFRLVTLIQFEAFLVKTHIQFAVFLLHTSFSFNEVHRHTFHHI